MRALAVLLRRMLFATPALRPATELQLVELDALHAQIGQAVAALEPAQQDAFHATARAATVAASAAIEGFHVTPEDAVALVTGNEGPAPPTCPSSPLPAAHGRWSMSTHWRLTRASDGSTACCSTFITTSARSSAIRSRGDGGR